MIINASPLIIFSKINRIDLLIDIYSNIEITHSVYEEVVVSGIKKDSRDAFIIKDYMDSKHISIIELDKEFINKANKISNIYCIELGEAESIALALQKNKKEIIIDERAAREAARSFGIKPIGSLRVLLIAYKKNLISEIKIRELLNEMESTKYRFSPNVINEFWLLFNKLKKVKRHNKD